jgi:anionic cell wall polymer biosynthesis LytR-Cps2A-Psr (LCP) family protein
MAYKYNKTKNLDTAIESLAKKVSEVTNISIPYYAIMDFEGFSTLIEKI